MQSGISAPSSGIFSISAVRKQLIADLGIIELQVDAALSSLEILAGKTYLLIPELNSMKTTATTLGATINSMLGTVQSTSKDINSYKQLLKDIGATLNNPDDLVSALQDASGNDLLHILQLKNADESIRALEDILSDTNVLLETANSTLDNLNRINDVLNDYNRLPQGLIVEDKELTILADQTLEQMHLLIADIPALSSFDAITETINIAARQAL